MTFENFAQIIREAEDSLMFLMLFYCGEPFVNQELVEMVRFAKDKGITLLTSTNGHFLNDRKQILQVLTSGLDRLLISLYGATRETYAMYENRGNFDKVVESIRFLAQKKTRTGLIQAYH
jgi:MoaA/NifB/PqqE/SkfB family radical SAM enzyme